MTFQAVLTDSVSVCLQLILLWLLLRGPFRRYIILLLYCIAQLITTAAETFTFFRFGRQGYLYRYVYWTDQITLDILLLLLVIALTYRSLEGKSHRAVAGKAFTVIVLVTLALPFLLFRDRQVFHSRWFDGASQVLTFGIAIMNLVLWTTILSTKRRDPQLLTVSVGLGVAMAGEAVAWGGHQLLAANRQWVPDLFGSLTHVLSLYIWCRAFWKKTRDTTLNTPSS